MSGKTKAAIAAILALLGVWAYWPAIVATVANWSSNPDYSHGFLVPFICAGILYARRSSFPGFDDRPLAPIGLSLLVVAALFRYVAGRFYLPDIDPWTIPFWIGGCVWMLCGWKVFRWAAPAIGFLWFAMPLPATIELALSMPLQRIAAGWSVWVLQLFGQPAIADGTVILLDDHQLDVERACSGLRMFFGILALAVATITLARPGLWKSIVLLVATIPVSITANVVRVATTALLLKYFSGEAAHRFSHDFAALAMIPLAAVLFGLVLWILQTSTKKFEKSQSEGTTWVVRNGLIVVAVAVCLLLTQRYFSNRTLNTLLKTAARYEEKGDLKQAASYLSRYYASNRDNPEIAAKLAELYERGALTTGGVLRSVQLYRHAWELQPEKIEYGVSAARLSTQVHDYRLALDIFADLRSNKAKTTDEEAASINRMYAAVLVEYLRWEGGRADVSWKQAIDVLNEIIASKDYSVWHAATLANALVDYEELNSEETSSDEAAPKSQAIEVMQQLIKDKPNDALAWLALYEFERTHGSDSVLPEKDAALNKAIELATEADAKTKSRVNLIAANAARESGDWKSAESYLQTAVEAEPNYYVPYLALAQVYLDEQADDSQEKAIQILQTGLDTLKQKELSLLVPLASLLVQTEQFEKAEALIEPLERILPSVSSEERGAVAASIALVRARIAWKRNSPREGVDLVRPVLTAPELQQYQNRFPKIYADLWTLYGDLCTSLGELDIATNAYQQAILLTPRFSSLRLQLANVATQAGNLALAEQQLSNLTAEQSEAAEAFLALANVEIQRQKREPASRRNWTAATKALQSALKAGASQESLSLIAGELLLAQGRIQDALEGLQRAIDNGQTTASIWRGYTILNQQIGNQEEALRGLEEFRKVSDDNTDKALLAAQIFSGNKELDKAVETIREALKAETDARNKATLYIELSRLYLQAGDLDKSIETLDQGHDDLPNSHRIIDEAAGLAWLQQDWDRLAQQVKYLEKVEGEDGTEWRAYKVQILLAQISTSDDPRFREVITLIQFINQARPNWPKAQYLYGELSLIQGELEAALASYQRAWKSGSRNILLADRIIDVLTRLNRFTEAQEYVTQASELLALSPQLFDRAAPYYARGSEREQALTLAQSWVKAQPNNADAQLRLGRVLLILSEGGDDQAKENAVEQAEQAFKQAITASPSDMRTWVACVMFYDRTLESRDKALAMLQDLSSEVSIGELDKSYVLAQLYSRLNVVEKAREYYLKTISLALQDLNPKSLSILNQASIFYASQSPTLAEFLCRSIIDHEPDNLAAKQILAQILLAQEDNTSTTEIESLLKNELAQLEDSPSLPVIRLCAKLFAKRDTAADNRRAIDLLESILEKSPDDQRLLASLYERLERSGATYNLLESLALAPNAQVVDLTSYLDFWQTEFLTKSLLENGTPGFEGTAKRIYQRLATTPAWLSELFRWRLREMRLNAAAASVAAGATELPVESGALTAADLKTLLNEVTSAPAFAETTEVDDKALLMIRMMGVLLHEGEPQLIAQLQAEGLAGLTADRIDQCLLETLITNRHLPESSSKEVESALADIEQRQATNTALIQLLADWRLLQGNPQQAVDLYNKVLAQSPGSANVKNNLALAYCDLGNTNEAHRVLDIALAESPDDPQLLDTLSIVAFKEDESAKAIQILENLVQANPTNASAWMHLADGYQRSNATKKSQDALTNALGLGIEQSILTSADETILQMLVDNLLRHSQI
ncbi:exosortase [Aeoliella mucimassa]|uniref:Tetratricopeptide repeat protein n=1 Tax=Aeoliella mucimassa TaxID=2527972 RepID=A0A518AK20_9BACT|nr:exosortase [Aeoliella mucimassa]QDU55065.1 tetratricopeptide repeat protein [Aeoliella mucimassa]